MQGKSETSALHGREKTHHWACTAEIHLKEYMAPNDTAGFPVSLEKNHKQNKKPEKTWYGWAPPAREAVTG